MQTSLSGFFIKQEIFRMIFLRPDRFSVRFPAPSAFSGPARSEQSREAEGKKIVFFMKK